MVDDSYLQEFNIIRDISDNRDGHHANRKLYVFRLSFKLFLRSPCNYLFNLLLLLLLSSQLSLLLERLLLELFGFVFLHLFAYLFYHLSVAVIDYLH
jgi:hypothetical protein